MAACVVEPGTGEDESIVDDESMEAADISPEVGGKAVMPIKGFAGKPGGSTNGISYHGGPVMLGTVNAYVIYYGAWTSGQTTIINDFLSSIGGSGYQNIQTSYNNGAGTNLSNSVSLAGTYSTTNYLGNSLTDNQIQKVVSDAISQNKLPSDANGVYFVITDKNVNASSGFCTQYCGWHTHATISGKDIKYSFVGNPDRCPSSCAMQTTSPNGDAGVDGLISILAHELDEAQSDPDLNAWYDNRGYENEDKCAWTFGTTYTVSNGSMANLHVGNRDYLVQRNWVNAAGGYCAMTY
jgi:hypothetical protein